MKKIQIEPGSPAKTFKPKEPFYLDKIKISFKIVELTMFSPAIDYSFTLEFVSEDGEKVTMPFYLRHPYFSKEWELPPLTILNFDVEKVKFNQFKISSNETNPKSVRLEIDFYKK